MAMEIVLPGRDYPLSRRWPRYAVDLPVVITFRKNGKVALAEGHGSELSCGGMAVFLPTDLDIGDLITLEFTPPYSTRSVTMMGNVRNRRRYSYGVEFVNFKKAA
jgi:hypothetical protein